MNQVELLRFVVAALERLRVPYLVTGSVATIYYGETRFTNDIDVVIELPAGRATALCQAFPSTDFYVSEEMVREAATQHGQFNVIHPQSGLKVDFIVAEDSAFNRSRFQRAVRARPSADCEANFAAMEDVILKKLEYYRDGRSEKHLRDITGILKVSGDRVDWAYVAHWASLLAVDDIWKALLARVAPGGRLQTGELEES